MKFHNPHHTNLYDFFFQTQKTVFTAQNERKCNTHFKKVCWIDYEEKASSETVRLCSTKPERKCDLNDAERLEFGLTETQTHYETICETRYTEKNVTEDIPVCKDVRDKMCNENGEDCMEFTRRVSTLTLSEPGKERPFLPCP